MQLIGNKKIKKEDWFFDFSYKTSSKHWGEKGDILNSVWENVIRKGIHRANIYKGFYWSHEPPKIKGNTFLVFMQITNTRSQIS